MTHLTSYLYNPSYTTVTVYSLQQPHKYTAVTMYFLQYPLQYTAVTVYFLTYPLRYTAVLQPAAREPHR